MLHSPRKRTSTGRRALQVSAILVIVLISLNALKYAIVEQLAVSQSVYLDLASDFQTRPDVLVELARREQVNGNLHKAHQLYIRAINSFALHSPSWLGLAEVLMAMDKNSRAVDALKVLDGIGIDENQPLWQKAQLARDLKQDTILLTTLKKLLRKEGVSKRRVFNLAGAYWQDVRFLLQNFDSAYYPEILGFFLRNNRLDKAMTVWDAVKNEGVLDIETTVAYISFLLENNEFDLAVAEWRDAFQKNGPLLYNGNFEDPILNAPFGWQVMETKGAVIHYNDFGGGLTISFDGTENAAFMLSQVTPLYPGEHIFRGSFETTSLTSQQRPYFLISGYNCQGLHVKDTMLPPSEYKTEFAIPFTVPGSCKAVKIDLVRNRASVSDTPISGSVTLDDLAVDRIVPPPEIQSPPPKEMIKKEIVSSGKKVDSSGAIPDTGQLSDIIEQTRQTSEKDDEAERDAAAKKKTKIFINPLKIRP